MTYDLQREKHFRNPDRFKQALGQVGYAEQSIDFTKSPLWTIEVGLEDFWTIQEALRLAHIFNVNDMGDLCEKLYLQLKFATEAVEQSKPIVNQNAPKLDLNKRIEKYLGKP